MKVLTAPGATWGETDMSLYTTGFGPTTAYIMGFTEKGEIYKPMEFTSRTAWSNYYGVPRNEAERYSYAAVTECLDQGGRLIFARLPYDNAAFERVAGFKYTLSNNRQIQYVTDEGGNPDPSQCTPFYEIKAVDDSIDTVVAVEPSKSPTLFSLKDVDDYRTGEKKVPNNSFVIVDMSLNQYGRIQADSRKNNKCELLGIMPVVTTAANAMLAQSLIDVKPENVIGFETVGAIRTVDAASVLSSEHPELSTLRSQEVLPRDSAQLLNTRDWYVYRAQQEIRITEGLHLTADGNDPVAVREEISAYLAEYDGYVAGTWDGQYQLEFDEAGEAIAANVSYKRVFNSADELLDWIQEEGAVGRSQYLSYVKLFGWHNPEGDDAIPGTVSQEANGFFPTINFDGEGHFERDHLKKIGVVVYKMYIDHTEGSKINYEPVEAFCGSLCRTDKDPQTGATVFIDDIVNSQSEYINLYSNCFNSTADRKRYENDIDMLVVQPGTDRNENATAAIVIEYMKDFSEAIDELAKQAEIECTTTYVDCIVKNYNILKECLDAQAESLPEDVNIQTLKERFEELERVVGLRIPGDTTCPSLGFYSDMTKQDISVSKSIYDGMNKCFENVKNINEYEIDLLVDAGLANIASYTRALFGDKGQYDMYITDDVGNSLLSQWKVNSNNVAVKTWKTVEQKFDDFCKNKRCDCMFVCDGLRPLVLQGQKPIVRETKPENTIDANIIPNLRYSQGLNTSYAACYMNWLQIADDYSGDLFWCPPSILAMGSYLFTDTHEHFWKAPAGLTRGRLAAVDVSFNPSPEQAGYFYEKNFNYAIKYPDEGIILEGQKTLQTKATAFDRVNVRRLFLRLERQCYKTARPFVYEGNTAYNRQRLVDALDPYFKDIKNNIDPGLYDYKIICDETINTPEVIDRHELKVKIGIKPTKTIEFIYIDFVCGRTGQSWTELGF